MSRRTFSWRKPVTVALALSAALLGGCGSGNWSTLGGAGGNGRSLSPVQRLVAFSDQWAPAQPRFMDILNTDYLAAYQTPAGFANGVIEIQYEQASHVPYLNGQIRGSGLKPNFCYQMKLMGKPGTLANGLWRGGSADMTTNKAILQTARWWNYKTEDSAFTTTSAATVLNSTDYKQGWVPGYTYFGYFLTDASGNIRCTDLAQASAGWVPFAANRCFHITGKIGQESMIPQDTAVSSYTVDQSTAFYPSGSAGGSMNLWYQKEPDNPIAFSLPLGSHDVVLMITEESFHNNLDGTTRPAGGYWDTVWVSDWSTGTSPKTGQRWISSSGRPIQFSSTSPATTLTVPTVVVTVAPSGRKWVATAKITVTDGSGVAQSGVTVKGQWSGVYSGTTSSTTGSGGLTTLTTSARTASSGSVFRFDVTSVAKSGYVWDAAAAGSSAKVP